MSLPLIAAQPGIFVADHLSTFDNTYIVVHQLELTGQLNLDALRQAVAQGMYEADTLRMQYTTDRRGDIVQIIQGRETLPDMEVLDLREEADPQAASGYIMQEDMDAECRVNCGKPLIRHTLFRLQDDYYIWYQRYHHMQVDAFSFTALTRRMAYLYSALVRGAIDGDITMTDAVEGSSAPAPFETAVQEYEQYQLSSKYSKDAEFWKKFCSTLPEAASICPHPLAGVEPSKRIIRNKKFLDTKPFATLCSSLIDRSSEMSVNTVSPVDLTLALLSVWLLRLSNRTEMTTGFIFMRRLGSAALHTSGPFINVLPLPISLGDSNATLLDLAKEIAKNLRAMRRHQKYDSEKIVRDSKRSWDSNPLFGPVINFKAFDFALDLEGLDAKTHHIASGPVRDLELVLYIDETRVEVEYLANADRYDKITLDNHFSRLDFLLDQFAAEPQLACSMTNLMLPEEVEEIVTTNETRVEYPPEVSSISSLMGLVQHQSELTPCMVALQDDGEFTTGLTYEAMIAQVHALAHKLQERGVKSKDIVAVALHRSAYLSLAIQAILLVGAAWLPLDPDYPQERLRLMIEDASPSLLIVDNENQLGNLLNGEKVSYLVFNKILEVSGQHVTVAIDKKDPAYVIYTSGSTGKPKGVVVSHEAIINRLLWMQGEYQLDPSDGVLQKTSISFDVSVWEFFWPLITGARLVMAPPDAHRDPHELQRMFNKYRITTVHFVPSMLAAFMTDLESSATVEDDGAWRKTLRRAFCSGEALATKLSRAWETHTAVPLYNLYGPTEAAIDVTSYPAFGKSLGELTSVYVPIGSPVWNTQVHILDSMLRPLPEGIAGDLYISGIQLAIGYLNRPKLTEERFITVNGIRMYRTGDVARWLSGGHVVDFLGRSDDQVKLRGQRIELGEIDAALESLEGVQHAVTLAQVNPRHEASHIDSRQLVSYIVMHDSVTGFNSTNLQRQLSQMLPVYMVPTKYVQIDTIPFGSSGKLDRRALPSPFVGDQGSDSDSSDQSPKRQPSPGMEQEVAAAFADVLGCDYVSAEDEFFSLGGHSLLAVKLVAHLRSRLNLPVTIGQIMQHPRVESLAEQLSDTGSMQKWKDAGFEEVLDMNDTAIKNDVKTVFCFHAASGFSWQFGVLHRYLDPRWKLIGIQSANTDGPLGRAGKLEDVTKTHLETLLRLQDRGQPFYLLGYSLGGTLAHSIAARLEELGHKVAFLGLLDTWPPETQNWNAEKGCNELNQEVLDAMRHEKEQFLRASANGDASSQRMFNVIEANFENSKRLLATARSSRFDGCTTLFVAQKTFPANTNLNDVWRPYADEISIVPINCSHADIVSPVILRDLGPKINQLLLAFL